MKARTRVDQLLVDRGLAETKAKAHALVLAGVVFSGEQRLDKPGRMVAPDLDLSVRGAAHPWVSRGGVKLAHGFEHFGLSAAGKVCLDVGASTGGFTDVLLQGGAERVYAVDVGRGQLDWKLRNDPRVVVLEGVNARSLSAEEVPELVDLIVCDASFIGLEVVLPAALALAKPRADLIALIKPQFEVGPERVGKGGVVCDPALHEEVTARIQAWLAARGWHVLGVTPSPLLGPAGNREFLVGARRG
ncbi:MAG: TlyA family RNA methyltransferase [Alphaproteobacteria bacterium]|nr:TlyA family RNA methyltransferase [Alphaproteobacteria bacterium]